MSPAHTLDKLLDGRVTLQQPAKGYRAAIDPVLLAAAIPARPGQKILDLGCGAGAAMFCLAARVKNLHITGLERDERYHACAAANISHNAALGAFTVIAADLRRPPRALPANAFDHVMANPPYHPSEAYDPGRESAKASAHAMPPDDKPAWIKTAHTRLRHRGALTLIVPAAALPTVLAPLHPKFGGITILPLAPHQGEPAKRLIIRAAKDSKAPLRLLPGMILHEGKAYTPAIASVLRDAAPLVV